jgi:quinol monooxygenase YgiN
MDAPVGRWSDEVTRTVRASVDEVDAMSVLMTLRVSGDPKAVEATEQAVLDTIISRAKEHGLIRHQFYGTDKEVLVVDEWPDQDSFQQFFDASPEIKQMMDNAGVTAPPQIDFWRPLDMNDSVG